MEKLKKYKPIYVYDNHLGDLYFLNEEEEDKRFKEGKMKNEIESFINNNAYIVMDGDGFYEDFEKEVLDLYYDKDENEILLMHLTIDKLTDIEKNITHLNYLLNAYQKLINKKDKRVDDMALQLGFKFNDLAVLIKKELFEIGE